MLHPTSLHPTTLHPATLHPTSLHPSRDYPPRPHPPIQPIRPLRILLIEARQLHAAVRAVDELEIPDVHPDVRHAGSGTRREQQHVPGAERIHDRGDFGAGAGLIPAHPRQPDAVLPVGVLNQSRAIEPVVRRPAPDVRRPQGLDRSLHHVDGIAADRGRGQGRRELGRAYVPALTASPFAPSPSPSPSPSHRDSEYRTHAPARVAARIPEAARPAVLEPIAQFRSQGEPAQRPPFHAAADAPLGGKLLRRGVGREAERQAGERVGSERGSAAPRLDFVPQPVEGRGPGQDRRQQPPHGDQQMGEPAGHVARPSRYPLRVRATRASAARTMVKAPPAAAGSETLRPASRAIAATMTAPAMAGSALRPSVAWLAVTIPPIQARNVPSIHHTGRYHQVLPPPIASHVQGYALKGRSSTMSIALNTTVPTRPTAAAPAMPSVPRAAVHHAGKKATTTPAASTTRASTPPRTASPARLRDAATTSTTATPVTRPTKAPPRVTVRKSERS